MLVLELMSPAIRDRDKHHFFERTKFIDVNKIFVNDGVFKKKKNKIKRFKIFEWPCWSKNYFSKKIKKTIVFYWRMMFSKRLFKLRYFLLNERFFQLIFLEISDCFFYWTKILLDIVKWENEQNKWKINDNFKNKQNQFFEGFIKKSRNEKQTNAPISTHKKQEIKLISFNKYLT